MKQLPIHFCKFSIVFTLLFALNSISSAQSANNIDWSRDTVSKAMAIGARNTYVNMIKGSGQPNATQSINLSVGKLKTIIDACNAINISQVSVLVISLRQNDIAVYRRLNPETTATDNEIRGSQILVFRIPRSAFPNSAASIKAGSLKNNPLILSMASFGLFMMETTYAEMPPAGEDLFFAMGVICPPPASCGD